MENVLSRVIGTAIAADGNVTIAGTGTESLIGTVGGTIRRDVNLQTGEKARMGQTIWSRGLVLSVLAVLLLVGSAAAANAQVTVGGHVGFVIPWVTHAGGQTTTISDRFQIGFPIGVTFRGQGRLALDLEMVPSIAGSPQTVTLTVDPGVVWSLSHGVGIGMRMAFDVNSSQFGFIPLVNKGWDFKQPKGIFKRFFVEADFPFKFNRPVGGPNTNPFTFATHFGLGF